MYPDPGRHEARYRVSRAAQRGWSTSLIFLPLGLGFLGLYLPLAVVFFVLGAITALPLVVGLAVGRTALRADYAGITLGADLRDGWALRWDRAVFVPWADVEQIVIYPGPGFPTASRAPRIGIQRRPSPRVTAAATRPIAGWRLDRDRLAAVIAVVAPGVPVIDTRTIDAGSVDATTGPKSVLGPPDP